MPAGAGGLGRARPFGEHSNDRHQEAKEHNLFHVPPSRNHPLVAQRLECDRGGTGSAAWQSDGRSLMRR
jgi:hypothetical protein